MSDVQAMGTGSIEIDPLGLEARLKFFPQKDGILWSLETISSLLREKGISPIPAPKTLQALVLKLSNLKEPQSIVIAQGIIPEDPIPEQVDWESRPVPGELSSFVDSALKNAGAPEIYRITIEDVEKEKRIKKPSLLPFLAPKEELVISHEKREVKTRVQVDNTLIRFIYTKGDEKLGTVSPPRTGKPGKNIFGKVISPKDITELSFLLGSGLKRTRNEVYSTVEGIVRIGKGWADLVPLIDSNWIVEPDQSGFGLILTLDPKNIKDPRTVAPDILDQACTLGVRLADLIPVSVLEKVIQDTIYNQTKLSNYPLTLRKDGRVRVDISPDKLRASLYMHKGTTGGTALELKSVSDAIRNSGVRGLNSAKLKEDILAFFHGSDIELDNYALVEGQAPQRGKDKEIQLVASFLEDEERNRLCKRIQGSSRLAVPLDEETQLAFVSQGVRIAQVSVPPLGPSGKDVFGASIPGLPGNDPEIKLLGGLTLKGRDIITERVGLLVVHKKENTLQGQVLEYRDSQIKVQISDDAMQASLELVREEGSGLPLSAEDVSKALIDAGVLRGVDGAAVARALKTAFEEGTCSSTIVAQGTAPVGAGASAIKWLITPPPIRSSGQREGEKSSYKTQGQSISVSEGTPLAEIVLQGAEGRAGFNVKGNILDPETAASVSLGHDDSIREETLDRGLRLVADKTGELLYDGWTLSINSLVSIKGDVNPSTGNINFLGEIRISGKVSPGFAVIGGKDVLIGETVEAALISSGAKVVIHQGIIGAGKGVVRAKQTIEAAFVEQATLLAVKDINIMNSCLACNIKTNGRLNLLGEKGHLIGGLYRAKNGIDAMNIGSERGSRTDISFGQDYLVMDQIEVIEQAMEKIKAALLELDSRIKRLVDANASLDAARTEKVRLMKLLEKHGLRLFTLREKFEEHHISEIRVRGTIFPGVVMESHGRYYEIKQKRSQVVFFFNKGIGRIQEKPL